MDRRVVVILEAILMLGLAAGCASERPREASPAPSGREETGTVKQVGHLGYGIVPDRDPGTRYAPDRLPAEFQVDGLRVIFSGEETAPPEGARLWGTYFRLTAIRKAPPAAP
jgi:hypothetical protein